MQILGITRSLWPVHPQPLPDELLSSWLVRLAHANGHKVHTLCALHFGRHRQIWNRDIDSLAPAWLLQGLAEWTGIESEQIFACTLRSLEGILFGRHHALGSMRWILPLGIYHRTRRRHGLQYCPLCLKTDADAHYRRRWRLAFYTCCERHQVMLRDACPKCGCPVMFHRAELGHKSFVGPVSLADCFHCRSPLSDAPLEEAMYRTDVERRARLSLSDAVCVGSMPIGPVVFECADQLFDVLHQWCKLLMTPSAYRMPLPYVEQMTGTRLPALIKGTFERQSISVRHVLITHALWLLEDWPDHFLAAAKVTGMSRSRLEKDMVHGVPKWYASALERHLAGPSVGRSPARRPARSSM